jgi:hypothetical protein
MRLRAVAVTSPYVILQWSTREVKHTGCVIVGGQMTCGKYGGSSAGTNR